MYSKIQELRARLRAQEDLFVLEKTHAVYNMRRKTLENTKIGIKNIDDRIVEARALDITSFENIHARPIASRSSKTSSESSEFEKEGEDAEHEDEQPSALKDEDPGNASNLEASQPSISTDKII